MPTCLPDSLHTTAAHCARRSLVVAASLVAATLTLGACGGGGDGTTAPLEITAVSVSPGTLALNVGATGSLAASLAPSNATGTVTWTSSSPSVATVSGSGSSTTVTAVAVGTTTITATAGGKSGSAQVTVSALTPLREYAQLRGLDVGAAVSDDALRTDTVYRRVLRTEFNSVTPENNMKFGPIHPSAATYSFAGPDTLLAFATANNMKVHGHVLLWHSQQPAWLTAGTPTRASLLAALKDHIETVVGRYAGKIASWDVANEMISDNQTGLRQSFWTTIVGPDVIDSAFTWARRRDPSAKLFLNDYSVETIGAKSDSLFALAMRLKNAGIPIDGVGLQAHLTLPAPTLAQLTENVARFAAAGFDVRFTELDVRLADGTDGLAAQATAYASVVAACRSTSRCKAVTTWGFTDKYSWISGTFAGFGRGLPFDFNFNPKPAYVSMRDALK